MNNKDLLPCPFCQGDAQIISMNFEQENKALYSAQCMICYAKSHRSSSYITAINNWNRRTDPSDL